MKKIFVTGGHGFLGKSVCIYLKNKGYDVIAPSSKDCNLLNSNDLNKFSDIDFFRIFHLAAWTQAGDFCLKHPGEQWLINQQINTNTLNWWHKYHAKSKLIFMGTSCSYAANSSLEEWEYLIGEPIESLYTYAMTKRMLLQGALALEKQFGLKWLCLVPSTLYGPSYHTDGRQMHFIFDLIRKILRGHYNNEEVVLWGDGKQKREIVHVDDFIKALDFININCSNDIVNIGSKTDATINEFAKIISKIVGYDHRKIIYDTNRYVGASSKKLSIKKLNNLYPSFYDKNISEDVGITSVINWFKETNSY